MKVFRALAVGAVVVLAGFGANVARADSAPNDPLSKITVPTDPVLEPCADVDPSIVCFSSNSLTNPVDIAGPTAAQLASDPDFDIITNFIYEPCTTDDPSSCDASAVLSTLFLAIVPTVPNTIYTCVIGAESNGALTPAFNGCVPVGFTAEPNPPYELLELTCNPSVSACTGMTAGEEGTAELMPEPDALSMLAIGIGLVVFFGWKRRKLVETSRDSQANLATA